MKNKYFSLVKNSRNQGKGRETEDVTWNGSTVDRRFLWLIFIPQKSPLAISCIHSLKARSSFCLRFVPFPKVVNKHVLTNIDNGMCNIISYVWKMQPLKMIQTGSTATGVNHWVPILFGSLWIGTVWVLVTNPSSNSVHVKGRIWKAP